jgi:hypothetical protein
MEFPRLEKTPPPLTSFAAFVGLQTKHNNQQISQLIQIEIK